MNEIRLSWSNCGEESAVEEVQEVGEDSYLGQETQRTDVRQVEICT